MSRSHKVIDSQSTFDSVFPEESRDVTQNKRYGDIDAYRASWEKPDYVPRHGKVITDHNNLYEGEEN